MSRLVSGIGGLFFRANDPGNLTKWYQKHFGIRPANEAEPWTQEAGYTVFAPFKKSTTYFGSMEQQFMINFRVTDLDKLLGQLKAEGVRIDEQRQEESYGKFAWVYDPEGNKIELWEPK